MKQRWNTFSYKRIFLFLLIPFFSLLTRLAYRYPYETYRFYTKPLYYNFMKTLGRFVSLIPFSLGEFLIYACILFALVFSLRWIKRFVCSKEKKKLFLSFVATVVAMLSIIYSLFVLSFSFNYAIPSYGELHGITTKPASVEDLELLCQFLIEDANTQRKVLGQEDQIFSFEEQSVQHISKEAQQIYSNFAEKSPYFNSYTPLPKLIFASKAMSYLNITGVYFSFTFEANINTHVPECTIPATMLHELSHAHGYMREDEANFLAYKAAAESDSPIFRYSGTILALIYATNAYSMVASPKEYQALVSTISPEVRLDLNANNEYWRQFESPVAELSTKVNDRYLKSNKQPDGVNSYGLMVDLLIAEYGSRFPK